MTHFLYLWWLIEQSERFIRDHEPTPEAVQAMHDVIKNAITAGNKKGQLTNYQASKLETYARYIFK